MAVVRELVLANGAKVNGEMETAIYGSDKEDFNLRGGRGFQSWGMKELSLLNL